MPKAEEGSFDDLLDDLPSEKEKSAVQSLKDEGEPTETPEQARIRELEARLAALSTPSVEPVEKTREQKEEEHRIAVRETAKFLNAEESLEEVTEDDDSITIHFVETGLTFAGNVWQIGQTVQVKRGGTAYELSKDRHTGVSWLEDLSPEAQRKRWGKVFVGAGLWTGPEFNDELAVADAKRGTAVPVVRI